MTKVDAWPRTLVVDGAIVCNPAPEQCRRAGYELITDAERDAAKAAAAAAAAEHEAYAAVLRQRYRDGVHAFCALAGIAVVDKFADAGAIESAIETANAGEDTAKALQLTQLALAIQNTITELRRKDGDDAWERI